MHALETSEKVADILFNHVCFYHADDIPQGAESKNRYANVIPMPGM